MRHEKDEVGLKPEGIFFDSGSRSKWDGEYVLGAEGRVSSAFMHPRSMSMKRTV